MALMGELILILCFDSYASSPMMWCTEYDWPCEAILDQWAKRRLLNFSLSTMGTFATISLYGRNTVSLPWCIAQQQ